MIPIVQHSGTYLVVHCVFPVYTNRVIIIVECSHRIWLTYWQHNCALWTKYQTIIMFILRKWLTCHEYHGICVLITIVMVPDHLADGASHRWYVAKRLFSIWISIVTVIWRQKCRPARIPKILYKVCWPLISVYISLRACTIWQFQQKCDILMVLSLIDCEIRNHMAVKDFVGNDTVANVLVMLGSGWLIMPNETSVIRVNGITMHIDTRQHLLWSISWLYQIYPDSKVHGANMGPTWVLSAPDGHHVGPMNLTIRVHW